MLRSRRPFVLKACETEARWPSAGSTFVHRRVGKTRTDKDTRVHTQNAVDQPHTLDENYHTHLQVKHAVVNSTLSAGQPPTPKLCRRTAALWKPRGTTLPMGNPGNGLPRVHQLPHARTPLVISVAICRLRIHQGAAE